MAPQTRRALDRKRKAKERADRKRKGKCQVCGKHPAKPSKNSPTGLASRCVACARIAAKRTHESASRLRPALKKLGICQICGCRQAEPSTTSPTGFASRCGACAEQQNTSKAERTQSKLEEAAMKLHLIHEDGFYQGPSGQIRHVLHQTAEMALIEVVDRGIITPNHTASLALGERKRVKTSSLAAWAIKEVPDPRTQAVAS